MQKKKKGERERAEIDNHVDLFEEKVHKLMHKQEKSFRRELPH